MICAASPTRIQNQVVDPFLVCQLVGQRLHADQVAQVQLPHLNLALQQKLRKTVKPAMAGRLRSPASAPGKYQVMHNLAPENPRRAAAAAAAAVAAVAAAAAAPLPLCNSRCAAASQQPTLRGLSSCVSRSATSLPFSGSLDVRITRAPADASALTVSAPMPLLPPVTTCDKSEILLLRDHALRVLYQCH